MRHHLLKDKAVKFAGYKKAHPLINEIEMKVQTNGVKKPQQAIYDTCNKLVEQIDSIEQAFREASKRHRGDNNPELGLKDMYMQ